MNTSRNRAVWVLGIVAFWGLGCRVVAGEASPDPGIEMMEAIAEASGDRLSVLRFEEQPEALCPEVSSLVSLSGPRLVILTPNASLRKTSFFMNRDVANKEAKITYQNENCRYVITARRFGVVDGREVQRDFPEQTAPAPVKLPARLQALLDRRQSEVSQTESPSIPGIRVEGRRIAVNPTSLDPNSVGYTKVIVSFADTANDLAFNGLLFFGPNSATIFLANAPTDLAVNTTKSDNSTNSELSLSNAQSRISLTFARERLKW
jgi:hypothetical protein